MKKGGEMERFRCASRMGREKGKEEERERSIEVCRVLHPEGFYLSSHGRISIK